MRIIRAIVAGDRNPDVLATYRDVRSSSSNETIRAALVGTTEMNISLASVVTGTLRRLIDKDAGLRPQAQSSDRGTEQ